MKKVKIIDLMIMACVVMLVCVIFAQGGETKYASGTTSAAVDFSPFAAPTTIASVYATTDLEGGVVKIYAWNRVTTQQPTTAPLATNIIYVVNEISTQLTTNDLVMYVHSDGTLDYRTVSAASTSNVTLNANISQVGSTDDRLYELAQKAQLGFDTAGAGTSTPKHGKFESNVFSAVGPIRVVQDGTGAAVINVTTK